MHIQKVILSPPSLEELAERLQAPLATNYHQSSVTVETCPDLRQAPFNLASKGLCGDEKIADIGGQPNLFPRPRLDRIWNMHEIGNAIEMSPEKGSLIGAGAGPFHIIGQNSELAPNLGWEKGLDQILNQTRIIKIISQTGAVCVEKSPSLDCGLMANLYGSEGNPGQVLKITARGRRGDEKSFTECIRKGIIAAYGDDRAISLGGAFVVKSGKAVYHVMPDFPPQNELPFKDRKQVDDWLTWHNFDAPVVCLSVFHSADPGKMGLRMEHTHAFSAAGKDAGGHYHYEANGSEDTIEYEGYFNTAKALYRVDNPSIIQT
ncbi:ester hydrolase c11orf54-like protein [Colletotrichum truncatum]|uniref:Ester hydrolase c11orf54-like protein n=1 Tax=Colletotrichum truncatum TaxID=5467 RepID=A0ACC3YKQ0_COLTU|nr:ester hydrolase c11orf54-like protein [Colletotrichum truncatum]KAF6783442.1 ester hydrolase c11orf54-like protein [Colletotrichum truncatum]